MTLHPKQELGRAGEEAACRTLKQLSFQILARNYVCPAGEIDLICRDGDCIVFVEVKTRSDEAAADPEENIGPAKQRRLERAAKSWLARHRWPDCSYRFDALSVIIHGHGKPKVRHIRDAFLPSR